MFYKQSTPEKHVNLSMFTRNSDSEILSWTIHTCNSIEAKDIRREPYMECVVMLSGCPLIKYNYRITRHDTLVKTSTIENILCIIYYCILSTNTLWHTLPTVMIFTLTHVTQGDPGHWFTIHHNFSPATPIHCCWVGATGKSNWSKPYFDVWELTG